MMPRILVTVVALVGATSVDRETSARSKIVRESSKTRKHSVNLQAVEIDSSSEFHFQPFKDVYKGLTDGTKGGSIIHVHEGTKGDVEKTLLQAHADLASQLVQQEHEKSATLKEIEQTQKSKALKETLLLKDDQWWNRWFGFGVDRATLRDDIKALSDQLVSHGTTLEVQKNAIERLKAAVGAKLSAAEAAGKFEKLIVSLKQQGDEKEALRKSIAGEHAVAILHIEAEGQLKADRYDERISKLTTAIDNGQAEHDLLTGGGSFLDVSKSVKDDAHPVHNKLQNAKASIRQTITHHADIIGHLSKSIKVVASALQLSKSMKNNAHPLHQALEEAKAAIRQTVVEHEDVINHLSDSINVNKEQTEIAESQKQEAIAAYDDSLKELSEQLTDLQASKDVAVANKKTAEDELASTTADGEAEIEKLANTLQVSIDQLTEERTKAEEDRTTQKITNENAEKDLRNQQAIIINNIESDINSLQLESASAETSLRNVQ